MKTGTRHLPRPAPRFGFNSLALSSASRQHRPAPPAPDELVWVVTHLHPAPIPFSARLRHGFYGVMGLLSLGSAAQWAVQAHWSFRSPDEFPRPHFWKLSLALLIFGISAGNLAHAFQTRWRENYLLRRMPLADAVQAFAQHAPPPPV